MKRNTAFTLSEVLITLSILGVVAAISIPNVIQQYQKRLTITKLKMVYSDLEKAATNMAIATGCLNRDVACTNILEGSPNQKTLTERFLNLSGMKDYKAGNVRVYSCVLKDIGIKSSSGNSNCTNNSIYDRFYVNSVKGIGYMVNKSTYSSNNAISIIVTMDTKLYNYKNLFRGKDVFHFMIYDNFLVSPEAVNMTGGQRGIPAFKLSSNAIDNQCSKNDTSYYGGWSCAAKIIKDGWKITYY